MITRIVARLTPGMAPDRRAFVRKAGVAGILVLGALLVIALVKNPALVAKVALAAVITALIWVPTIVLSAVGIDVARSSLYPRIARRLARKEESQTPQAA